MQFSAEKCLAPSSKQQDCLKNTILRADQNSEHHEEFDTFCFVCGSQLKLTTNTSMRFEH